MTVTANEVKEIVDTTPSLVKSAIQTAITNLGRTFANSPDNDWVTGASGLENIAISKATPSNGIITFNFKVKGLSVSFSYRDD